MFKPTSIIRGLIEAAASRAGYTPNYAVETNDRASVRDLVAEGLGIALVPPWTFPLTDGRLKRIPFGPPGIRCIVGLASAHQRSQSPAVLAFVDHVRGPLAATLHRSDASSLSQPYATDH